MKCIALQRQGIGVSNTVYLVWLYMEPSILFFKLFYIMDSLVCINFSDIGDIAGVAEVTIRQSYRLLLPKAAQLFPSDFQFHTPIENLPPI